jgi:transposase InsO family protein
MFAIYSSNDMWQVDILDVSEYSSMNDGYKYLLCAIDVFSRKVFLRAAKNKRDITDRMNEMLYDKQPIVLQTCNRREFISDSFKEIVSQHNVRQSVVSMNESKSKQAYIERFKRTLISKLPQRYIDEIDEIVSQYNSTKHSSLNDTPNNRYEQNPNRGIITVTEKWSKEKKDKLL